LKKKKLSQKRAGEVAQGVGPEFKLQYCKKKKKKERERYVRGSEARNLHQCWHPP
jgi:hypothetical protein